MAIGVHPSTIIREIQCNCGVRGKYNWERAQSNAVYQKHRRPGNRSIKPEVSNEAIRLLVSHQWSPEQISGYLQKGGKSISNYSELI